MTFADAKGTRPLWFVEEGAELPQALTAAARQYAEATGFTGKPGQLCLIPGDKGISSALFGAGSATYRRRNRFALARAADLLPEGAWSVAELPEGEDATLLALGWMLQGYRFDRYKSCTPTRAQLVCPEGVDAAKVDILARAEMLTRDLINTPPNDMGPDELEAAARDLAARCDARIDVITGDALREGFPLIATVGQASPRAPRLIELNWGQTGPTLTLVGKGVCYDTGGLNLKPGASMGLMKKDMGGAATVLGAAQAIMELGINLRLRVLIPAVENSVSGAAYRPQDVWPSRKGLSVEITNTDAEGRLVLADALTYGAEGAPDLMVSYATLTGAARVALGPEVPPFYTDHDDDAAALSAAAARVSDPIWRMPFWDGYEDKMASDVADLDHAPSGAMAGSINAALFLRRFTDSARYLHLDIYGWQPSPAPARPKGGIGQGARALIEALPELLDLPA